MDFIDENQMVFIDNSNGEESIELVNHSMESSSELSTERKDIAEVNNCSFFQAFTVFWPTEFLLTKEQQLNMDTSVLWL